MAAQKDYFGLSRIVSIILALIPFTSFFLGVITRFKEGKIVAGILRLVLGWNIIYILDLISVVFSGKIVRILNI